MQLAADAAATYSQSFWWWVENQGRVGAAVFFLITLVVVIIGIKKLFSGTEKKLGWLAITLLVGMLCDYFLIRLLTSLLPIGT